MKGMKGILTAAAAALTIATAASAQEASSSRLMLDGPDMADRFAEISSYSFQRRGDDKPRFGFSAREVASVFPEAVRTNEKGVLVVDYTALMPPLIAIVNHLAARVEEIEEHLEGGSEESD